MPDFLSQTQELNAQANLFSRHRYFSQYLDDDTQFMQVQIIQKY